MPTPDPAPPTCAICQFLAAMLMPVVVWLGSATGFFYYQTDVSWERLTGVSFATLTTLIWLTYLARHAAMRDRSRGEGTTR